MLSCVLALGIDDIFTCLAMFIHPSARNMENFINTLSNTRFNKLKVLRLDKNTVS